MVSRNILLWKTHFWCSRGCPIQLTQIRSKESERAGIQSLTVHPSRTSLPVVTWRGTDWRPIPKWALADEGWQDDGGMRSGQIGLDPFGCFAYSPISVSVWFCLMIYFQTSSILLLSLWLWSFGVIFGDPCGREITSWDVLRKMKRSSRLSSQMFQIHGLLVSHWSMGLTGCCCGGELNCTLLAALDPCLEKYEKQQLCWKINGTGGLIHVHILSDCLLHLFACFTNLMEVEIERIWGGTAASGSASYARQLRCMQCSYQKQIWETCWQLQLTAMEWQLDLGVGRVGYMDVHGTPGWSWLACAHRKSNSHQYSSLGLTSVQVSMLLVKKISAANALYNITLRRLRISTAQEQETLALTTCWHLYGSMPPLGASISPDSTDALILSHGRYDFESYLDSERSQVDPSYPIISPTVARRHVAGLMFVLRTIVGRRHSTWSATGKTWDRWVGWGGLIPKYQEWRSNLFIFVQYSL